MLQFSCTGTEFKSVVWVSERYANRTKNERFYYLRELYSLAHLSQLLVQLEGGGFETH
jgi:hypothetical protein